MQLTARSKVWVSRHPAAAAKLGKPVREDAVFVYFAMRRTSRAKVQLRVLTDAGRAELERRAAICEGCENNQGVRRERGKFQVWAVKCAACGTCGLRPLARGCVLTPPKFGP